jgi:hypothetical protein
MQSEQPGFSSSATVDLLKVFWKSCEMPKARSESDLSWVLDTVDGYSLLMFGASQASVNMYPCSCSA